MLVQNISPVNYSGNQSFSGKSKNVEAVVNKAFDKIVEAKSKNLDSFIGTTKQGDNVVIQETLLGKAADLFIYFVFRKSKKQRGQRLCGLSFNKNYRKTVGNFNGLC